MFMILDVLRCNKMNESLTLIEEYAHFEKSCNLRLRKLAIFIKRRAEFLQKEALTVWFKNTLKPVYLF